jgi:hypothetical protein
MKRFRDVELVHRIYEADESFRALDFMVHTKLFLSQIVLQLMVGTGVPIVLPAISQVVRLAPRVRVRLYVTAGVLTLIGIFAMRWNVVIGGQLFSKSFLGYTTYKLGFATHEGLLPAILLMILPFGILAVLLRVLPPWEHVPGRTLSSAASGLRRGRTRVGRSRAAPRRAAPRDPQATLRHPGPRLMRAAIGHAIGKALGKRLGQRAVAAQRTAQRHRLREILRRHLVPALRRVRHGVHETGLQCDGARGGDWLATDGATRLAEEMRRDDS